MSIAWLNKSPFIYFFLNTFKTKNKLYLSMSFRSSLTSRFQNFDGYGASLVYIMYN